MGVCFHRTGFGLTALAALGLIACSATKESDPSGTGGSTPVVWSGGSGGTPQGGGDTQGGNGGSDAGGGGAGGTGGNQTGGGGSSAQGDVLLVATGAQVLLGSFTPTGGWATSTVAETSAGAGVALMAADRGVGVYAIAVMPPQVRFVRYDGVWGAPSDIGPAITARAMSLHHDAASARLAFHGEDFMHYFAGYDGQSWAPSAEPVAPAMMPQSFGPSGAAVTAHTGGTTIAYAGSDQMVYVQTRDIAGAWQAATPIAQSLAEHTPAVAALSSGELLAVWVHHQPAQPDDHALFWSTTSGASWSAASKIDGAVSDDPPALAALDGGDALLSFRDTGGLAQVARFTGGAWAAPGAIAAPNVAVPSAPSVVAGIGVDAELAFVDDSDDQAYHTRLSSGMWSPPNIVGGGGLTEVVITVVP